MSIAQSQTGQGLGSFAPPPMEGVPSLGSRQDVAEKLAAMGRYDDDEIAHVAEGEVIVPAPIMKYYPEIKEQVFNAIQQEGLDPNEFVVGNEMVARNPDSGMQEFGFLSKIFKKVKKIVKKAAPIILTAAALYFGGPAMAGTIGKAATTAAKFAVANPATAGFIAGTGTGLLKGDNLKDSLKRGIKVGAVTGTLGNVFGTQGVASLTGNEQIMAAAKPSMFSSAPAVEAVSSGSMSTAEKIAIDKGKDLTNKNIFQKAAGSISDSFAKDAIGTTTNLTALGLIGSGLLASPEEMPEGEPYEYEPTREGIPMAGLYYDPATGTYSDTPPTINVIQGPIRRVNAGGAVAGPGTGTSDSIPAMLSDGEFVMTAKAVRAMGDGSRQKGAARMYQLMNRLEGKA